LKKISALRSMISDKGLSTLIQVDGGINNRTIHAVSSAGADVFVAGSAIFDTGDYAGAISVFRKLIRES
jgi:ribulose-phosphate 3-epimerase